MTKRDDAGVLDLSEPGMTEAMLVGFRIGSAELHLLHKIWLDDNIVPIMVEGGGATIAGYASRSGSAGRNMQLSAERSKSVANYVRTKTAGRGLLLVPGITLDPALGESAAKAAGQKDGTEDPYYRAVHVKAWRKPVPPPPPTPKPPAPKRQVVVFRRWTKSQLNTPGEPGNTAADLGEALGNMISPDMGERRYDSFPSDYAVNGVRDEFTIDWQMIAGGSDTTYTREITYTWGPKADQVHLLKRTRQIAQGGGWTINRRGFFSRSEIWNLTIAPDAQQPGI